MRASKTAIRRMAARGERIDRLVRVGRADQQGRHPKPFDGFPAGEWLLEQARQLEVIDSRPKQIVMGRHLINLGYEPGPWFGEILGVCYEAQLNGEFENLDTGITCVKQIIKETES